MKPGPENKFFKGVMFAVLICLPFWLVFWHVAYDRRPNLSAPVAGTLIILALLLILWGYNRTLPRG